MDNTGHWIEVSISVDNEVAEAVAEALSRYVANGVVVERDVTYLNAEDAGTPFGPVRVYGYISTKTEVEEKRRQIEEALWHLGQIMPVPAPTFRTLVDEDWMTSWKKNYHPIPIGERLLVLPAWIEQGDPERIAVRIDPSMAFGTGTHPSTQLCMELAEKYTIPGRPVIDVGCGSGILSIAALKLGASHALGVDIDPESVRATEENAARNGVIERVETGLGSVSEINNGEFSLQQAPLVLANILMVVILNLFEDGLAGLVQPGGTLVLAGLLEEQAGRVIAAAESHDLVLIEKRQQGDWVALAMQLKGNPA